MYEQHGAGTQSTLDSCQRAGPRARGEVEALMAATFVVGALGRQRPSSRSRRSAGAPRRLGP
jgi:hypothetical protein